jgi:hypothetical protein
MNRMFVKKNGLFAFVGSLVAAGSLLAGAPARAQNPADLAPPAGNMEVARLNGVGVQIYQSAQNPADPTKFIWKFDHPEATLSNDGGHALVNHFGGPTWQSINDGSSVVGVATKVVPSVTPNTIPWVLLVGASHDGHGMMGQVTFIQRLFTVGGAAPTILPTALGQTARVPYTATYVFFVNAE